MLSQRIQQKNMVFLADFTVIEPEYGLLFWTAALFLLVWYFLGKKAFKPIAHALKQREESIAESLQLAEKAREDMANMKAENDTLLAQAREERSQILKDARAASDSMVNEAKNKAKEEAKKILQNAMQEIENQKLAAITEVKNQAGNLALDIASKLIRRELKGNAEQEAYLSTLLKEMNLN